MAEEQKRDLEERTFRFAHDVRKFVKILPKSIQHFEDGKQLIRSSGSVGANYIEAQGGLSKKDFRMRIRICRKEIKESRYWLMLIDQISELLQPEHKRLLQESTELLKIFNAIVAKLN